MAGIDPRPCPFCKCSETEIGTDGDDYWVECIQCVSTGPSEGSHAEAVMAWNTRRFERCEDGCELQRAFDKFTGSVGKSKE